MSTAVIERQTISTVIANVTQARSDIAQAFTLLESAKQRLTQTLGTSGGLSSAHLWEGTLAEYTLARAATDTDRYQVAQAWRHLIDLTGIRHFMTPVKRDELEKQMKDGTLPALTVENALATLQSFVESVPALLQESAVLVARWLCPENPRHKTNRRFKVPYKVIITWGLAEYGQYLSQYRQDNFRALGNVLSLLDGQGIKQYPDDLPTLLGDALRKVPAGEPFVVADIEWKWFLNRNLHATFRRHDLIDRLNQIVADHHSVGEEEVAQ